MNTRVTLVTLRVTFVMFESNFGYIDKKAKSAVVSIRSSVYSTTIISVPRWLSARAAGVSKPQCLPNAAEVYLLFRNINLGHFENGSIIKFYIAAIVQGSLHIKRRNQKECIVSTAVNTEGFIFAIGIL